MKTLTAFEAQDMKLFEPTEKVGLLATVNEDGLPHLTLITAMQAKTPRQIIWGQFTEGLSKQHVKSNPRTAFLIMTLDRKMWRGKADYTHAVKEGDDYIMFNEKPMFRYNSYFGINTVHYMDLRETTPRQSLPLPSIVASSLLTLAAKSAAKTGQVEPILTPWGESVFNAIGGPKFLAAIGDDGYPFIVPLMQCMAADSRRLVFSPLAYGADLARLPKGAKVAVYAMTMQMETILVRGDFLGYDSYRLLKMGAVDIDYVYNSMPPKHGQIYPRVPLTPVVDF